MCIYSYTHIHTYISPRTDVQALNEREESDAGITHTHEHARTYTQAHILTARADAHTRTLYIMTLSDTHNTCRRPHTYTTHHDTL